jgi:hypothetical protein
LMTIGAGGRGVDDGVANSDMANNVSHAFGLRGGSEEDGEKRRGASEMLRGKGGECKTFPVPASCFC